jgi:hypothetical protein
MRYNRKAVRKLLSQVTVTSLHSLFALIVGTGVSSAYNDWHLNEKPLSAPAHHAFPVGTDKVPIIPTHERGQGNGRPLAGIWGVGTTTPSFLHAVTGGTRGVPEQLQTSLSCCGFH